MDETVCVIVGQWNCLEDGQWEMKIKKNEKIRSIPISADLCFEQLERLVAKAFNVDTSKKIIRLSFWSPEVSNICTQTRLPPVAIESDSDVFRFITLLSTSNGMNIFAQFEDLPEKSHGEGLKENAILADNGAIHSPTISYSFEDSGMLQAIEKMEAAYKKRAGKQPEHCDVKPQIHGRIHPSVKKTTDTQRKQTDDPDALFNELANLVDREISNPSPQKALRLLSIDQNNGTSPSVRSQGISPPDGTIRLDGLTPSFNLGIEESDQPTLSSDINSEPLSSSEFSDENAGIPSLLDEDDPVFDDPPPMHDNVDLDDGSQAIYVGRVFQTKAQLHECLAASALENMFCYKIQKSDKRRVIAVCVDRRCDWRVYATGHRDSENFEVRTIVSQHSCDVQSRARFGEKASSRVLANLLQTKYANGSNGPRARDIPDMVRNELNLTITYSKAWHAKEVALSYARGNEEESFKFLSSYLRELKETNEGTITDLSTVFTRDGVEYFKYLFVAFGPSVSGVQFLRKVVVIDGTHMKGKYKGCLVAASCQDGNMQIFPLAFGVVDSENEKSWIWFLRNLTRVMKDSPELVFVSDRCPSIYVALSRVYPQAKHGSCTVHLYRNIKSKFKCEGLAAVFSKCARAYTVNQFQHWWNEINARSPACASYLTDIGIAHWSLAHFPGDRYNIMTSNIAESVNAALGKAVEYPIVSMLEFIRNMVMRWFNTRRALSIRTQTRCTPVVERLLVKNLQEAVNQNVLSASQWIHQVTDQKGHVYMVHLQQKNCTCRVFQVLKIPCSHALAARRNANIDVYSLVDSHYSTAYWKNLYEPIIMPVPRDEADMAVRQANLENIRPPLTKRPPGRPRKLRIPSQGEGYMGGTSKSSRCARCSGFGHNKATCKNPI